MTKRKVNVLSNELDQAPKTRAAGYGKVVDSMREEITEAMNGVNVPNIMSNESDQAPKTRAAGYEQNVLEPLKDKIYNRMEMLFMKGSKVICDYVNKFVNMPENGLICDQIIILEPGDSLSFEIKREKVENEQKRREPVSENPVSWGFEHFVHNFYGKSEDGPLKPGEVSTTIVIEKDLNGPYLLKVHAEQLEIPREEPLLSRGKLFHNPNVSDEKFQEIIGKKSDKN